MISTLNWFAIIDFERISEKNFKGLYSMTRAKKIYLSLNPGQDFQDIFKVIYAEMHGLDSIENFKKRLKLTQKKAIRLLNTYKN